MRSMRYIHKYKCIVQYIHTDSRSNSNAYIRIYVFKERCAYLKSARRESDQCAWKFALLACTDSKLTLKFAQPAAAANTNVATAGPSSAKAN